MITDINKARKKHKKGFETLSTPFVESSVMEMVKKVSDGEMVMFDGETFIAVNKQAIMDGQVRIGLKTVYPRWSKLLKAFQCDCGEKVSSSDRFCSQCGNVLIWEEE